MLNDAFFTLVSAIADWLPVSSGFNLSLLSAISTVMATGAQLGFFLPWSTIFACFSAVLVFEGYFLATKITMWVASHLQIVLLITGLAFIITIINHFV